MVGWSVNAIIWYDYDRNNANTRNMWKPILGTIHVLLQMKLFILWSLIFLCTYHVFIKHILTPFVCSATVWGRARWSRGRLMDFWSLGCWFEPTQWHVSSCISLIVPCYGLVHCSQNNVQRGCQKHRFLSLSATVWLYECCTYIIVTL